MMPEKLSPIERALCAASQMNAHESRRVLMLICSGGMTMEPVKQPTEGEKHYAKREKYIKRMKSACDDAIEAAKHETLRNIRKHFRAKPPAIKGAETSDPDSLPARLTFNRKDFTDELLAALREEANAALVGAATGLFDEIGSDNPWTMPGSVARAFLDQRANLLANVPDEIHQEIMQSIKEGLDKGETRAELMDRISAKFAEIGSGRAETIANTETAAAFNFARDKAMRAAGVTHKRWLHSQSPLIKEPRPTHVEADGQIVPIDEPFNVGGVKFMMPADDSMGAGPEDIINCHCVSIPVEAPVKSAGEKEGHPFRGNQYSQGESGTFRKASTKELQQILRADLEAKTANLKKGIMMEPYNYAHYQALLKRMGIYYPTDLFESLKFNEEHGLNALMKKMAREGHWVKGAMHLRPKPKEISPFK